MARIVGGFLAPHDPLITSAPDAVDKARSDKVHGAFGRIADRVRELKADTAIVIGDDHYAMFGPHCVPRCLIGIGDVDGPLEPWLGVPHGVIENNEPLARHIMQTGFDEGVDWAFAKTLTVDHSIAVPHHFVLRGNAAVKTVPIYLNAGVLPVIASRRAYQIGQSVRRAVESWPGDERVVVLGTGGVSHWVGSAGMGQVNEAFDRRLLDMVANGDVESLIALSDEQILAEGGNGCLEIKNWIFAMGVAAPESAELIAYEPTPEWITGLGFAELRLSA